MSGRYARNLRALTGAAFLVVALGINAGTAHTAPVTQGGPEIGYEAHAEGDSVVTSIDAGAFRITDTRDAIEVVDDGGKVVAALPLTIRLGDAVHPIDADLAGTHGDAHPARTRGRRIVTEVGGAGGVRHPGRAGRRRAGRLQQLSRLRDTDRRPDLRCDLRSRGSRGRLRAARRDRDRHPRSGASVV